MSLSPPEYIQHMLDEIDYILSRISDMNYESFVKDETLKRAFVRSIEVIGEASKKLPEDIKAMQHDIEWRNPDGHFKMPHLWPGQNAPATGLS